jgi:PhzF family phenazine biosynthesis protein
MNIEFYHVDTFCKDLFSGDPAAVCPLEEWPAEKYLRNIAAESYLTKTAFFVREQNHFYIRWFTPEAEVDLCGHATLAAAHVLFHHRKRNGEFIEFNSRSGRLGVALDGELLTLDLPSNKVTRVEVRAEMSNWFSDMPVEAFEGRNVCLLVFANEGDVMRLKPNLSAIDVISNTRGVIVTAKGDKVDFVSRYFTPQLGIPETHASGSAHAILTGFWAARLNKRELIAIQLSSRRAYLECRDLGKRTELSGRAKTFLAGKIFI